MRIGNNMMEDRSLKEFRGKSSPGVSYPYSSIGTIYSRWVSGIAEPEVALSHRTSAVIEAG
jgi:hypothetical protein